MRIIGLALIALALALAGAWAYAEIAAADGELDSSGRRIDCIPRDHADPTGDCLWTPELTKVEVKVEFEYPYCEVKLEVENNLDELPDGVRIRDHYDRPHVNLIYIRSDDVARPLAYPGSADWRSNGAWGIGYRTRYSRGQ